MRRIWEEDMAVGDILSLNNSMATRLIRCLYFAALILILVMVILGLLRGARIMSRPAMMPPAMAANGAPSDATPAPQPPQMGMPGRDGRRFMMQRRMRGRPGLFGMGRNPMLSGIFVIVWTLVRGAIVLMIVRILAELALAILAMPRRSET
jgi:hypothetical protein